MFFRIFITVTSVLFFICQDAVSDDSVRFTKSAFTTPEKLRPRVKFWKDVFSKYGKHQSVVHHRMFPQIVFDVIDLRREGQVMGEAAFRSYKDKKEKMVLAQLKQAFSNLANGAEPNSELETRVAEAMRYLGGGLAKYRKVLDDDLIRTQTGIREKFADAIRRSGRYMPFIEEVFERQGLPIELTRLPFIESSFDYTAYSSVGAAGIWQFMRRTAISYMTVNDTVDERRDPITASRSAAKYLANAYQVLGSWPLAVTSYNHGVAGVSRKVKQLGTRDIVEIVEHPHERLFGFASNNFYPELLAAIEVYNEREKLFPEVRIEPVKHFVERNMPRAMSAQQAANYFGVSIAALRTVNYALAESVWTGRRQIPGYYKLKIPVGSSRLPDEEPEVKPDISVIYDNELTHIVRKGETLRGIAINFSTTEKRIKELNSLPNSKIYVGQKLKVKSSKVFEVKKEKKTEKPKPESSVTNYKIKKGDTLSGIAKRFGVSVDSLKKQNKLGDKPLQIGKTIKITKK